MYGVVRPLVPSLGTTDAVVGEFVRRNERSVLLVKRCGLELYGLDGEDAASRLRLISEVQMNGIIYSIGVLRLPGCVKEIIILGFEGLKASILSWDGGSYDWKTEKLVSFQDLMRIDNVDDEDVTTSTLGVVPGLMRGRQADSDPAIIKTDPSGRCFTALAKSALKLFIVPIAVSRKVNQAFQPKDMVPTESTFWIDLAEYGVQNVKDLVFLEGTFEPTLFIIYEPIQTWSGRVAIHSNTVHAIAYSIDITRRSHFKLWSMENIPYDAFSCIAVPESSGGGSLVVSSSSILHFRHGQVSSGMTVNACGEALIKYMESTQPSVKDLVTKSKVIVDLEIAKSCFLEPATPTEPKNSVIITLKGGELYFISLPRPGVLGNMEMTRAGSSVASTRIAAIKHGYFILASRVSEDVLVQYERKVQPISDSSTQEREESMTEWEEEMREVFTVEAANTNQNEKVRESWVLKKRDSLATLGPGADMAIGRNERAERDENEEPREPGTAGDEAHEEELEIVMGGGHSSGGGVTVLERSIRPIYVTKRDAIQLPGCKRCWTVIDPIATRAASRSRERRNMSTMATNSRIQQSNESLLRGKHVWTETQKAEQERLIREQSEAARAALTDEQRMEREQQDEEMLKEMIAAMQTDVDRAADEQFVMEAEQPLEETPPDEDELHSYMLLSSDDSTIVLRTGIEITELVEVDFRVDCPTLEAGNVLGNRAIVQVHREGARLLRGRRLILDHALPYDSAIRSAQVCDPLIMLKLENGMVVILRVEADDEAAEDNAQTSVLTGTVGIGESLMDEYGGGMDDMEELDEDVGLTNARMIQIFETNLQQHGFCTAATLYKGPLLGEASDADSLVTQQMPDPGKEVPSVGDEEYFLYGEEMDGVSACTDAEIPVSAQPQEEDRSLLLVTNREGELKIFDMKTSNSIFRCRKFFLGPKVLYDEGEATNIIPMEADLREDGGTGRVVDIAMYPIGPTGIRAPVLVSMFPAGHVVIYVAFLSPQYVNGGDQVGRSRVRFRKIVLEGFARQKGESVQITGFGNVGGRCGLFVTGETPFLLFADRGYPRAHPLYLKRDLEVLSFAQLHNVMCPRGFVFVEKDGVVRIGALTHLNDVNLETPWPIRRVNLRCTVHRMAYHAVTATYGLLTSHQVPKSRDAIRKAIKVYSSQIQLEKEKSEAQGYSVSGIEEDTTDASALGVEDPQQFSGNLPTFYDEKHELHLYRPDTWALVKKHPLKDFEVGLCISSSLVDVYKVSGGSAGTSQVQQQKGEAAPSLFATSVKLKPKHMLVVGTGYLRGEDASSRGRILMFEVARQQSLVSKQEGDTSTFQIQLIAEREVKGQVSAIQALQGYVVVGVGPKVEVYKLVEDEIVCCSFFFAQLFCTSITSLKQYVIVGDMFKSVSLLYWRDRNKSLNFLGKDYEPLQTFATEFLLYEDELSLICSDFLGNIQLFNYENATVAESRGGTRLLANGGFHVGSKINRFHRARVSASSASGTRRGALQQTTFYGTLDCGLGAVVPIKEQEFRLLSALQARLAQSYDLPHYAGLNHKAFRTFRPQRQSHQLLNKRLLDGQLLRQYFLLDAVRKKDVARNVGSTVEEIFDTLEGLDLVLERL